MEKIEPWTSISRVDLKNYWIRMGLGYTPIAWKQPPQIGHDVLDRLSIVTSAYRLYYLHYTEFYRLMVLKGDFKFVHPNGLEEVILEVYKPALPAPLMKIVPLTGSNVVPFKR